MSTRDRLGFDAGSMGLEDALAWAARYGFHYVDFNADQPPNTLDAWDEARVRAIRQHCERHDIHLGLHTLSGVNVAEVSPYVSEAVDTYLRANTDVATDWGAPGWLGDKEVHRNPGEGNIDFASLFQCLESSGYPYHYMMAFGSLEDKLVGRDYLSACWHEA